MRPQKYGRDDTTAPSINSPIMNTSFAKRIAAMNALGDARVMEMKPRLVEIGRTEEGPEAIFAYAALYKMGQTDMLIDITNAAAASSPMACIQSSDVSRRNSMPRKGRAASHRRFRMPDTVQKAPISRGESVTNRCQRCERPTALIPITSACCARAHAAALPARISS